jgi:hypothetical protein
MTHTERLEDILAALRPLDPCQCEAVRTLEDIEEIGHCDWCPISLEREIERRIGDPCDRPELDLSNLRSDLGMLGWTGDYCLCGGNEWSDDPEDHRSQCPVSLDARIKRHIRETIRGGIGE